jgi:steroid delta-isomerase-like uncharacterized protein
MSEANKALVRRWFEEVWNKGRADTIDEMFATEGMAHGLSDESGNPLRGPKHFREYQAQMRTAFPDMRISIEDMVAENDLVAVRCNVTGKHVGEGFGIAATNAPVEFSGMSFVRITDGKIVEGWNNFDFMRMYRQVGLL